MVHPEPARRQRRGRLLIPAVVAAAVVVLVTGSVLLRPARHGTAAAPAAVPVAEPFYVTANNDGTVSVRSAATGRLTARVDCGPDWTWIDASATADPRVFYLAADNATFSRLALTGDGRVRSLTEAGAVKDDASTAQAGAGAGTAGLTAMAVSPDGKSIAFAVLTGQGREGPIDPAQIEILSLGTGHYAVYPTPAGRLAGLAWTDGGHLAYTLASTGNGTNGVWIASTDGKTGTGLLAASRRVTRELPTNLNDGSFLDGGVAAPAGVRDVYTLGMNVLHGKGFLDVAGTDATTGKTIRTVFSDPHGVTSAVHGSTAILSEIEPTSPLLAGAGTGVLVIDGYGRTYRVDLATGRSVLITTDTAPVSLAW
jgi:hypothetical protein